MRGSGAVLGWKGPLLILGLIAVLLLLLHNSSAKFVLIQMFGSHHQSHFINEIKPQLVNILHLVFLLPIVPKSKDSSEKPESVNSIRIRASDLI